MAMHESRLSRFFGEFKPKFAKRYAELGPIVTEALRQHFRPEFLNRIDEVIFFHALGLEHMAAIVDIQVRGLLKRLEDRKVHVELTDAARKFLVSEGYDPMYGARPLKRTIQRRVLDPLPMTRGGVME